MTGVKQTLIDRGGGSLCHGVKITYTTPADRH